MMYHSTRDKNNRVSSAYAIATGLSRDGGLFVPETLPSLTMDDLVELSKLDYRSRAVNIMKRFLDDFTTEELASYAATAYSDNYGDEKIAPLHFLDEKTATLELWHGPTCAFKDMALQMLPHLLTASLKKCGEKREACILVATSGDTGKAALEGFADVDGTRICVFFPRDGVSEIQKLQMLTTRGDNVFVSAVAGNFDDTQTGVKQIFCDQIFAQEMSDAGCFLSSANSINWGRLLPQIVYYISAYCDYAASGRICLGDELDYCVPTGNFGNILAGWYAKQMGLPAGKFICASNENNVLTQFFDSGVYDRNRPFHTTISPSMDILVSSNLERLLFALSGDDGLVAGYLKSLASDGRYKISEQINAAVSSDFAAGFCGDADTKNQLAQVFDEFGYLMDTHTAVASRVLAEYRKSSGEEKHCIIVSTASPYKFAADVLAALGHEAQPDALSQLKTVTGVELPKPLAGLSERQVRFDSCVEKNNMRGVVEGFMKNM